MEMSEGSGSGKSLFLKYSEGCRYYLEDRSLITEKDRKELLGGNPSVETLRRVFYVAVPALEKIAMEKGTELFDIEALHEFYLGEHNERKFAEGELACLAFPARVTEADNRRCRVSLEPVTGEMWVDNDIGARPGDHVLFHRINLIEIIDSEYAKRLEVRLKGLGLNKTFKFPKSAIKYLRELKTKSMEKVNGNDGKDPEAQKKRGNASHEQAKGPEEAA